MRSNWRRRAAEIAARDRRETVRIAHHEASHAAISYVLGLKLTRLVVGRGIHDDSLKLQGWCGWETREDRSVITALLAGQVADAFFFRQGPERILP